MQQAKRLIEMIFHRKRRRKYAFKINKKGEKLELSFLRKKRKNYAFKTRQI